MCPKSLSAFGALVIVLIGLTIVAAGKMLWPVPVSPTLPYTIFAEPLPESSRLLQTFNVHTAVSRVDFRIRVRKPTVALLEVLDTRSGQVLRAASATIVPGDMERTFTFPVVGSSVQGSVYRPITFAISFPEQAPGTHAGVAVELTDPFPEGELRATGITIPTSADAKFRAYRDTAGLDVAGLLLQRLSNRKPSVWMFGLAAGVLGIVAVTALAFAVTMTIKRPRWSIAVVPALIWFLTLVALSAPLTNTRLITF